MRDSLLWGDEHLIAEAFESCDRSKVVVGYYCESAANGRGDLIVAGKVLTEGWHLGMQLRRRSP